ncbi:uncharacterized protein [Macrobrachium rosenbergii]|uniref:uncharacterized protein n=1 Tax=Macrobrachium rosenbergii TaxID=79674 RepID=UPI0034D5A208
MTAGAVRAKVSLHTSSSCHSPSSVTPVSSAPSAFDNFTVGAIRRFIHRKFDEKEYFTVGSLTMDLKTAGIISERTSPSSVIRHLHSLGFKYKTTQRKMYVRKESLDIICRRINALRDLRRLREDGRKVVYVDETWFTTRMTHSREWADTTQDITGPSYSRQVPPGEGERFVVVAAGTNEGFIEGSYLCYPAKSNQGDYHGEMNAKLFEQWLTTQLLPSLPEPSVLVLDNAPYHSTLTEESRCPTSANRKADLVRWLEQRRISFPPLATKSELLLVCQRIVRKGDMWWITSSGSGATKLCAWHPLTQSSTPLNSHQDSESGSTVSRPTSSREWTQQQQLLKYEIAVGNCYCLRMVMAEH